PFARALGINTPATIPQITAATAREAGLYLGATTAVASPLRGSTAASPRSNGNSCSKGFISTHFAPPSALSKRFAAVRGKAALAHNPRSSRCATTQELV